VISMSIKIHPIAKQGGKWQVTLRLSGVVGK
jgi:hypothetical protein